MRCWYVSTPYCFSKCLVSSTEMASTVQKRSCHSLPDSLRAPWVGTFVRETIASRSILCTDGWNGYNGLSNEYIHRQTILSSSDDPAHVVMPGVHQVASLLKRWLLGTHQGAFAKEHLQSYLEEFAFRFNRRTSHSRGLLFHRLLEQAVATPPVTEADILHGYHWNAEKQRKTNRRRPDIPLLKKYSRKPNCRAKSCWHGASGLVYFIRFRPRYPQSSKNSFPHLSAMESRLRLLCCWATGGCHSRSCYFYFVNFL